MPATRTTRTPVPRAALVSLALLALTGCATPDFRPGPTDPGAEHELGPGEHFETVTYQAQGYDTGLSLLVGLIPLSRPTYTGAYRDLIQSLGLDPDDPDLALDNMKVSSSFTSLVLADWRTVTVTADVLRVAREMPSQPGSKEREKTQGQEGRTPPATAPGAAGHDDG